ncbi:MAG: SdrD B-like domain-containing protein [Anaerolineae bacterium]
MALAVLLLAWGGAQTVVAEPPWPDPPPGTRTQLPILSSVGTEATSQTVIQVQNLGSTFTRAIMLLWGDAGACGPQAVGPFKIECTGLIKPGATWMFGEQQVPFGARSGIVYTFPHEDVLNDEGQLVNVADEFCERLFSDVAFNADEFRRFDLAYREGRDFFGLPTTGGQPVAIDVVRVGQGTPSPDLTVAGAYTGLTGSDEGSFDPVFGGFSYYVPVVYADSGGLSSWLYIQNSGLSNMGVELWFQEQNECLRAQIVEILCVAPGETGLYNVSDAVGPSFVGSVWIRTSQPSGVVVDHIGQDVLMTDTGVPAKNAEFDSGSEVLFGPLIYREFQGWETSITVQNLSGSQYGAAKVYFYDESGNIITTLVDYICPRGTQTFFLPVINGLPGQYVGAVRVESLTPFRNAGTEGPFVPIAAVAHLTRYTDPTASQIQEAISYGLFGESQVFDWQTGPGITGLLGVPSVLKQGRGLSTELAIQNVNPNPGFTDFVIYLYDPNGLLEIVCEKLSSFNVEYINFNSWGIINPGFVGSAVISGVYSNQRGGFGLSAVAIQRVQSILQFNPPGDEASGHEAFPIFTTDFDFEGFPPQCPGQPAPCTGDAIGSVFAFDYEPNEINPEGNLPVPNATVAGGGASTTTDGSGGYDLQMVPGQNGVTAEGPEVTTTNAVDGDLPASIDSVTTTAHFPLTKSVTVDCFEDAGLSFTLICKALLAGTIRIEGTATPISGATVSLVVDANAQPQGMAESFPPDGVYNTSTQTNSTGDWVLEVPLIGDTASATAPWTLTVSTAGFNDFVAAGDQFADDVAFDSSDCLNVGGAAASDALEVTRFLPDPINLCSLGSISGFVWDDLNSDDVVDAGEPRRAGLDVWLIDDADSIAASTTTDADGFYIFDNLDTTRTWRVTVSTLESANQNLACDEDLNIDFDIFDNQVIVR